MAKLLARCDVCGAQPAHPSRNRQLMLCDSCDAEPIMGSISIETKTIVVCPERLFTEAGMLMHKGKQVQFSAVNTNRGVGR